MNHRNGYNVSAVWLRSAGDGRLSVSVEIGGKWYLVIVEYASNPSHIFELKNHSQKELEKMRDPLDLLDTAGLPT